jgi:hypothetical protein
MTVRAKFRVESVTRTTSGSTINMQPVISGSPENESFYRYTPGGSLLLSTVNEEAAKQFEPGREYYLDFTPA